MYISLSGLIGAGKTTLANALSKAMGLPVHREIQPGKPIMVEFYDNMPKHAFHLQIYLLNQRIAQQQRIKWDRKGAVQDRSFYEDIVFVRMLTKSGIMSQREHDTYVELVRNVKHTLQPPHLLVHLDVPPEVALERIRARARPEEQTITLKYLQDLEKEYEIFLQEISAEVRVLRVPWSKFADADRVAEAIRREHAEMRSIREITL